MSYMTLYKICLLVCYSPLSMPTRIDVLNVQQWQTLYQYIYSQTKHLENRPKLYELTINAKLIPIGCHIPLSMWNEIFS